MQKLLEQPAQLEGRPIAPVGHDGRRDVARAIYLPVANRRAARSRRAALAALSLLTGSAALALAGEPGPGQGPGEPLSAKLLPLRATTSRRR